MPYKYTYEKVKETIESRGFILVTKEYINSRQKLEVICPYHGSQIVTFKRFRKGTGCFDCGQELKVAHRRIPIETVISKVIEHGYIPKFDSYKNEKSLLKIECPKHGPFETTWASINRGQFCRACGYEKLGNKTRTTMEEIIKIVSETPYELITKEYLKYNQKIHLNCKIHGDFYLPLDSLKMGQGCRKCRCKNAAEKRRMSHEDFCKKIAHLGYEVVTNYNGSHSPITVKCSLHGEFTAKAYSFSNGHGCPSCACNISKPEGEVATLIEQLGVENIRNSYDVISPLELDIYVPSLNLAIEYCGLHWHNELKKDKNYHFNKLQMCKEKNIRLLTIFEDEWLERQEQIKGYLKSVLGKNKIKLFARKTELKEVPKKEAKDFLETHHIQGSTNFEIAYGLYRNNELMVVMTGGPHHRQGHGNIFVLNRLAFKENVSIAGGSSKLLKALISYAKSRGFVKLLSWSDNRFSEGRVYESIGFILEDEHGPDYSYIKGRTRTSKQSCQKKLLLKKGAQGTMANTERELALTLGLIRIWDCGKKAWSIDLTK